MLLPAAPPSKRRRACDHGAVAVANLAHLRAGTRRLRTSARPLLQAALAAPLAWLIATDVLGHAQPIFAPISTLVAIGATVAQPWQRAAEIVVGVAIGVAVADALVLLIGHGTWQVGVMVLLAMAASVFVGGGSTFVIQSGVAAVLVASVPAAAGAASIDRFLDTLVGGACALLLTVLVLPVRPLRLARRALGPVLDELATTFELIGEGLASGDPVVAEAALATARTTGDHWARLDAAVGIGRQAARIAPVRRHEERELVDIAQCVTQLDYAIRDARIMARVAWRLVELGYPAGARLELSMREFAGAARALEQHLEGDHAGTVTARAAAARASRLAAAAPAFDEELVFTHLVGQVRSTSVDLLRATGLSRDDAITRMVEAVAEGRGEL